MSDRSDDTGTREVIDFVSSITDSARLVVEEHLPHGFVRLKVAEAERRQARHDIRSVEDIVTELARNSRDAGASRVLVGFQKEQSRYRRITVLDDGCGIPPGMHQVVFEPRVTSRKDDFEEDRYGVHGRGMALFSIRTRTPDARIVTSVPGSGTVISLTADNEAIPEKSDQATVPRLEAVDGLLKVGSGPHNVARVLLEMSVDCAPAEFYMGSFAEVLATVRGLALESGTGGRPAVWQEVAALEDARELAAGSAEVLGLPVSERNAYRIIAGGIAPLKPLIDGAPAGGTGDGGGPLSEVRTVRKVELSRAKNPLARVSRDDLEEMGLNAKGALDRVLGRYYLVTAGEPRVRRGRGRLSMTFYVAPEEEDD